MYNNTTTLFKKEKERNGQGRLSPTRPTQQDPTTQKERKKKNINKAKKHQRQREKK